MKRQTSDGGVKVMVCVGDGSYSKEEEGHLGSDYSIIIIVTNDTKLWGENQLSRYQIDPEFKMNLHLSMMCQ